jgi:hypothetical protein
MKETESQLTRYSEADTKVFCRLEKSPWTTAPFFPSHLVSYALTAIN